MNARNKARLDDLKRRRDLYRKAEEQVLSSQEYRNGTFTNRRAELEFIQKEIASLDKEITFLESGGKRHAFRITPRDL